RRRRRRCLRPSREQRRRAAAAAALRRGRVSSTAGPTRRASCTGLIAWTRCPSSTGRRGRRRHRPERARGLAEAARVILVPRLYALFLPVAGLLTVAPGPDTVFVLGAGVGGGARGGLLASAGVMTGLLVHLSLALVGVSALIAASPLAFDALRWAGAAYL